MNPVTAAYTGMTIEILGGALLALGLMTRYVAVPMLILALVIQFAYLPFDNQLFWSVLLGWYVIHGAGSISIDALLRKSLADSALPWIANIVHASTWVRRWITPFYLSMLRLWLAAVLLLPTLPSLVASEEPPQAGGIQLACGKPKRFGRPVKFYGRWIQQIIAPIVGPESGK